MVRAYEAVYILDPALDDARWDEDIEGVKNVISSKGGEVKEVQKWGRRRLAYEIDKKREGIYTLVRFDSDTSVPAELGRRFRLDESVLRHLIVLHEEFTPPPTEEALEGYERHGRGPRSYPAHPAGRSAPAPAAATTTEGAAAAPPSAPSAIVEE